MTAAAFAIRIGLSSRTREAITFLLVGGTAFIVDFGVYNLLAGSGIGVLTSKCISIALSIAVAYLGNRYLTFAAKRSERVFRELVAFVLANVAGGSTAVICLAISHYVLGLDNPVADNIAGNIIGVLLGTAIRYVLYRRVVFGRASRTGASK